MKMSCSILLVLVAATTVVPGRCLSIAAQKKPEPMWQFAVASNPQTPPKTTTNITNDAKKLPQNKGVAKTQKQPTQTKELLQFKQWLPTCFAHLHALVNAIDRSYTDIQLQTVLEHECMYEEHFPKTQEDGFEKQKHCEDFASHLVAAREAELADKSTSSYTKPCEVYWRLINPKKVVADKAPVFNTETMPAVSTALWCVIILSLQYFCLYTALVIVRTALSLNPHKFANGEQQLSIYLAGVQRILETACTTVTYAPMLCVLFLGVRMRAIQLSQGQTEKHNLPQPWVQTSMKITSCAVVAQVALVLLVSVMSGSSKLTTDEDGNLDTTAMNEVGNPRAVKLLTIARYVVMAMLYGGFVAVVVGVFMMKGPKEIWGERAPPVSPAVLCTILLSGFFFLVYLLVAITKTCFELRPDLRSSNGLLKLEQGAKDAKMTVNFAPMLCILFIGARMRALQIDPMNGDPQSWAQKCFFMCTFSVLLQCLLVILMPFVSNGVCKRGTCEGDVVFAMENPKAGAVMTAVRYICLLALYGGIAAVVYSVFTIEHPAGPEETPPVSPAMQCVINLTVQYFFVYTLLFVFTTLKTFASTTDEPDAEDQHKAQSSSSKFMGQAVSIIDGCRGTVMFAPMLAILFIGARMRALQLVRAKDGTISPQAGPQAWVQDGMFLATWAVFVQLVMAILVPVLIGVEKVEVDRDGNTKVPPHVHRALIIAAEIVRYLSLLGMYGGAMVVVVGIFKMTPETLPPHNQQTLVPGVEVPQPLSAQ